MSQWVHPSASDLDAKRDHYECVRDSRTYTVLGGRGFEAGFAVGYAQRQADDLYALCMESKGWTKERRD